MAALDPWIKQLELLPAGEVAQQLATQAEQLAAQATQLAQRDQEVVALEVRLRVRDQELATVQLRLGQMAMELTGLQAGLHVERRQRIAATQQATAATVQVEALRRQLAEGASPEGLLAELCATRRDRDAASSEVDVLRQEEEALRTDNDALALEVVRLRGAAAKAAREAARLTQLLRLRNADVHALGALNTRLDAEARQQAFELRSHKDKRKAQEHGTAAGTAEAADSRLMLDHVLEETALSVQGEELRGTQIELVAVASARQAPQTRSANADASTTSAAADATDAVATAAAAANASPAAVDDDDADGTAVCEDAAVVVKVVSSGSSGSACVAVGGNGKCKEDSEGPRAWTTTVPPSVTSSPARVPPPAQVSAPQPLVAPSPSKAPPPSGRLMQRAANGDRSSSGGGGHRVSGRSGNAAAMAANTSRD